MKEQVKLERLKGMYMELYIHISEIFPKMPVKIAANLHALFPCILLQAVHYSLHLSKVKWDRVLFNCFTTSVFSMAPFFSFPLQNAMGQSEVQIHICSRNLPLHQSRFSSLAIGPCPRLKQQTLTEARFRPRVCCRMVSRVHSKLYLRPQGRNQAV